MFLSPDSATADAATLDQLYIYYPIATAFVFLSATGFITYILFKSRVRRRRESLRKYTVIKKVVISLTLLASVLVGQFFYLTLNAGLFMLLIDRLFNAHLMM
ncbi:MAG TPA: hypothetical protein VK112_10060 [Fodinibius sp.]|nr:hypothetical protein [Fodinibius sp.]